MIDLENFLLGTVFLCMYLILIFFLWIIYTTVTLNAAGIQTLIWQGAQVCQ